METKNRSEFTANVALATAPELVAQQNGWTVGKNFFNTPKKAVAKAKVSMYNKGLKG